MRVTDALLNEVRTRLPRGRHDPYPASLLAMELNVDQRTVRALVHELRTRGELIGSTCSAGKTGYFLCTDVEDLAAGTEHLRSRALSMLKPFHSMRRAAQEQFGDRPVVRTLFALEDFEEASP